MPLHHFWRLLYGVVLAYYGWLDMARGPHSLRSYVLALLALQHLTNKPLLPGTVSSSSSNGVPYSNVICSLCI